VTDFQITSQKLSVRGNPSGQDNIVAISLKGFLDAYTYNELEQVINDSFNQNLYKFIVDLSQVKYMSGAGVGVFIGMNDVAQKNQGNMVLVRPRPNVQEVFDLLGLTQLFMITDDRESALKIFKGKSK